MRLVDQTESARTGHRTRFFQPDLETGRYREVEVSIQKVTSRKERTMKTKYKEH